MGCWHKNRITGEVEKLIGKAEPEHSARAVMQIMTTLGTGKAKTEEERNDLGPQVEKVKEDDAVPEKPNAFADGSLKQSRGACWQTGGAGVWMPGRTTGDINEQERKYTHQEEARGGIMLWCAFNTLIDSSTRC